MDTPFIIVIAGPNGVGKSTFAKWYLEHHPSCIGIVDPDAIARELNIDNIGERNVATGGHNIPYADQQRRFERTYRNFHDHYTEVCHEWNIYDAQLDPPRILATGSGGFATR